MPRLRWRNNLSWHRLTELPLVIQPRYAIVGEDSVDLRPKLRERGVDLIAQRGIAFAHAHRDVEHHRQPRPVDGGLDGIEREWNFFPGRVIARYGPPHDRHIDVSGGDGGHDLLAGIVVPIVAINRKAAKIAGETPPCERARGRRVVATDQLNPDLPLS